MCESPTREAALADARARRSRAPEAASRTWTRGLADSCSRLLLQVPHTQVTTREQNIAFLDFHLFTANTFCGTCYRSTESTTSASYPFYAELYTAPCLSSSAFEGPRTRSH